MFGQKNVKQTLGRKVGFGRFMMPVWAVGAAVVLVGAAAGQAVGPVLSGSTTGSVNLTVAQAITLATGTGSELGNNPAVSSLTGEGDSATTRNDEGTNFTVAIEMTQGASVITKLKLANHSGKDGAATLQLNIPAGIDVEAEETGDAGDVSVARLNANSWLMSVKSSVGNDEDDGVTLLIEPKDDLAPGFYTITGRIIQIAG